MQVPGRMVRLTLALLPVVLALSVGAGSASAVTEYTEGEEIDESAYADGFDYLLNWNGSRWVQSSRGSLGTLNTTTQVASKPSASGLTLLKTICFAWPDSNNLQGRHCFRKYKPNASDDGDPNYFYRIWWVTGSTAAKSGRKLLRVRDGFNTANLGAFLADWRPNGTTHPGSCFEKSATLGINVGSINASVGSTFTVCPETFGPSFLGQRLFRFHWEGKRGAGNWVGSGGGTLYAVPQGTQGQFEMGVIGVTCKTSESGC
jgi:hypothetical protein